MSNFPPIGFGFSVTGGGTAPVKTANTLAQLTNELKALATAGSGNVVIELDSPADDSYNFTGKPEADQVFPIAGRNITIRAKDGVSVRVRNLELDVKLDTANNILIKDINFRSNGDMNEPRDGITFNSPGVADAGGGPLSPTESPAVCFARITHCSFNGYFDIAIDSESRRDRPLLSATIDHCFFLDNNPGRRGANDSEFVRRGAINIGSASAGSGPQLPGHASVTVAFNVFVDVWRRCPRVANGAFAHVYNNLLFRWGFGDRTKDHWIGMAVGGGDGSLSGNNGSALIEANRFIPWEHKTQLGKALDAGDNTVVDIGQTRDDGSPGLFPNRFDTFQGVEIVNPAVPAPSQGFGEIPSPATVGTVTAKGAINWRTGVFDLALPAGITGQGIRDLSQRLGN